MNFRVLLSAEIPTNEFKNQECASLELLFPIRLTNWQFLKANPCNTGVILVICSNQCLIRVRLLMKIEIPAAYTWGIFHLLLAKNPSWFAANSFGGGKTWRLLKL